MCRYESFQISIFFVNLFVLGAKYEKHYTIYAHYLFLLAGMCHVNLDFFVKFLMWASYENYSAMYAHDLLLFTGS